MRFLIFPRATCLSVNPAIMQSRRASAPSSSGLTPHARLAPLGIGAGHGPHCQGVRRLPTHVHRRLCSRQSRNERRPSRSTRSRVCDPSLRVRRTTASTPPRRPTLAMFWPRLRNQCLDLLPTSGSSRWVRLAVSRQPRRCGHRACSSFTDFAASLVWGPMQVYYVSGVAYGVGDCVYVKAEKKEVRPGPTRNHGPCQPHPYLSLGCSDPGLGTHRNHLGRQGWQRIHGG